MSTEKNMAEFMLHNLEKIRQLPLEKQVSFLLFTVGALMTDLELLKASHEATQDSVERYLKTMSDYNLSHANQRYLMENKLFSMLDEH